MRIDRLEVLVDRFVHSMNQTVQEMKAEGARYRAEAARAREAADKAREEDRAEAARAREAADRAREEDPKEDRQVADRAREEDRNEADRARAEDRAEAARAREAADRARKEDRKEWNRRWGELANKMGTVARDIVAPSMRRIARELNCGDERSFSVYISRYRSDSRDYRREFDAFYVGTRAVLLNETKSTALSEYATRFVRFLKSGEFALYFPEYRDLPVVPVFSSLSLPDHLIAFLTKNGIYAVAMGEETMQVLNRDAVSARKRNPPATPAGN